MSVVAGTGCEAPYDTRESVSEEARALQMEGIVLFGVLRGAIRHAAWRESVSDGARALQEGGIAHVGGGCEAPYDTRESVSDGARAL
jgi:hypothetical protein